MRRTICRCAVQNILHDVQAAAECRALVATSSFAQRRTFLMALHDELQRNREVIIRANRRDCDVFGQQQQQRGTPSVTIPPTMPSAAAAAAATTVPSSSWSTHTSFFQAEGYHGGRQSVTSRASSSVPADVAPPRRRSSLEYVASNALSCNAAAATTEALAGNALRVAEENDSKDSNRSGNGSVDESKSHSEPLRVASSTATEPGAAVRDDPSHLAKSPSTPSGNRASAAASSASHHSHDASSGGVYHTEAGGGGGHLLLTQDHHLLISPLRLDKLHTTIEYLLCQPDPIAVPPSCWLHPYAQLGSGDPSERQRGRFAEAAVDLNDITTRISDSAALPHPDDASGPQPPYARVGRCTRLTEQLEVFELPVSLGMVGILSRFRPRISLDAVAMGLFAGNTVIVDGGVSLYYTNIALMTVVRRALTAAGLPPNAVVCVESYDAAHRTTSEWLQLSEYVDLAVVCGPPKLYQFASRHSTIPLMRATGQFSSVYVDQSASFEVALEVILNSKFQKLGAANAATTAIIHRDFPRYTELLMALSAGGAVLLGDVAAQERVPDSVLELASEEEYQGLSQYGLRDGIRTLCVKTVDSLAQALFFIESYGSKQSDCVVATDPEVCAAYCRQVDTAVALVNASTRLSSGVPLGCGVDFAISTSKAHCRGPLTLSMMTTRKLVARSRSAHHAALR